MQKANLSSIILALSTVCLLALPAAAATDQKASGKPAVATKAAAKPAAKGIVAPIPAHTKPIAPAATAPAGAVSENGPLPVVNADESYDLPDYPPNARVSEGQMQTYTTGEEDTFLDIARHFGLGYVEIRAANPDLDPWAPLPGQQVTIPSFKLLPRAKQEGIVVNLGEMRLYYFHTPGEPPVTFPLGIGSEGLDTPTGSTSVIRKVDGPTWSPTDRMRKLKPWLPTVVPAGPSNPLGTHALYLGWPTFLIHGSNKPWGIGRRVSSGCMRLYPEDIVQLFNMVPVGTRVTVVDQPILMGWLKDGLYLEANPSKTQSNEIEMDGAHTVKPLNDDLKKVIIHAAGPHADSINWSIVGDVVKERRGYPVRIAPAPGGSMDAPAPKADKPADKKADKKAAAPTPEETRIRNNATRNN